MRVRTLSPVYAAAAFARCCMEKADPKNEQGYFSDTYMALGEYYYGEKQNFTQSAKYFAKVAKTSPDPLLVVDARYEVARSYYTAFRHGKDKKKVKSRLKKAKKELQKLMKMPDVPEDRMGAAEMLLAQVEEQMK